MSTIKNQSRDRRYFTMLPNMIWKMGLSVYDLWFYTTLKRICGDDGECFYSTRQLSEMSGVSVGMISRCKESLAKVGLIAVGERPSSSGPSRDDITICDVWKQNQFSCSQGDQLPPSCSPHDQPRSQGDQPCSPHDQPTIRKKKNHRIRTKEEDSTSLSGQADQIYLGYPRKVGKQKALKAIRNSISKLISDRRFPSEHDAGVWILDKVKRFSDSPAGQAGAYTPHPATWFNEGRYDDDETEWHRRNSNGKTHGITGTDTSQYDDIGLRDSDFTDSGEDRAEQNKPRAATPRVGSDCLFAH